MCESVGDGVTVARGENTVLPHAHLAVDGDAAHGAAGSGQGIIAGAATGADDFKILGIDREDDALTRFDGT